MHNMSRNFFVCCVILLLSFDSQAVCPSPHIFKSSMENMQIPEPQNAVMSEYAAARFLIQATYGAKLEEIRDLQSMGYAAWIDAQLAMPASLQEPCMQATLEDPDQPLFQNSRIEAWYLNSVEGEDQLRQRTAFALSQIFVVSSEAGPLGLEVMGLAKYYDYLAINAFGNYRDILEGITLNTMMGFIWACSEMPKQTL